VFLQLPLVLNPGYLSFDELQWWDRADVPAFADLPWVPWTDPSAFQYRPLTFNLWLILAHALAAHAVAMHLLFVLLGTINALLLAACLLELRVRRVVAAAAAMAFVMSPYAAYTHGWTGTLADLLVVMLGLAGALVLLRDEPAATGAPARACALAMLAALALLAKESAVVVPILWLALALARHTPRAGAIRVVPALIILAVYLAARAPPLWLVAPGNEGYAWSLAHVPERLAEYALFPWLPPLFEVGPALHKSALRLALAAACCGAVPIALLRAGWRYAVAWIVAVGVALAPVLVLPRSFDHYAYLATVTGIGVIACAWHDCDRAARGLLLAVVALASAHGALVMLRMRDVGAIEQRFHGDLVAWLARDPAPVRIVAARPGDAWMLERWIANVPRYRGVPLAGRILFGAGSANGSSILVMQPDGTLEPGSGQTR
jgi:hypothetical protein